MSCTLDLKLTKNFEKAQLSNTFAENLGEILTPQRKATVS